ncbi:hypothetical protein KY289_023012 [Solanum tuberosum]|nr:hypothetical protein KY289_023012 [Solanum tuberosum]
MPVNETSKYHSYTRPCRVCSSLFIISTLEGLLQLLTQTVYTRYPIHQIHRHPPCHHRIVSSAICATHSNRKVSPNVVLLPLLRPVSRLTMR